MNERILLAAAAALSVGCTGCATILRGTTQHVSVEVRKDARLVAGATCTLSNDKGKWFVTTPASLDVERSGQVMYVSCVTPSSETGTARVQPLPAPAALAASIGGGGLISTLIDESTGAEFDYPSPIAVELKVPDLPKPLAPGQQAIATTTTVAAKPVAKATPGPFSSIAEAMARQDFCMPIGNALLMGSGTDGDTYQVKCMGGQTRQYACAGTTCRSSE
ncbi:hypothetical protein [Cupriavidus necator]